jgi:outer membrane protein OmpA-like peptidoglycan-associated protein
MSLGHTFLRFAIGAALVVASSAPARAQETDAEGCKDSPLITRFPGGAIHSCDNKEFDQLELPIGKDKDGGRHVALKASSTRGTTARATASANKCSEHDGAEDGGVHHRSPAAPGTIARTRLDQALLNNSGSFYYQTPDRASDATEAAEPCRRDRKERPRGGLRDTFTTGQATILPDSEQTLAVIGQRCATIGTALRVEGYTDNVGQPGA